MSLIGPRKIVDFIAGQLRKTGDDVAQEGLERATREANDALGEATESAASQTARNVDEPTTEELLEGEKHVFFRGRKTGTEEMLQKGKRFAVPEPVGQDEAFFRGVDPETRATMDTRAWTVNLEKIDAPEDVLNVLRDTTQIAEDPSVVITHAETDAAADEVARSLGLNPKNLKATAKAQGYQTAHLRGAQKMVIAGATEVRNAMTMLRTKRAEGTVSDADWLGFRQLLARHVSVMQTFSGMASEAGRQLNILKMTATNPDTLYAGQIADSLDEYGGREFSENILDALGDMDNLAAMNKLALDLHRPGAKDMLFEFWINSILSGIRTQGVNFLGNAAARSFENMEQVWAGAIGDSTNFARWMMGKDPSMHASLRDVHPMLYGEVAGFIDGLRVAGKTFAAGESSFDSFSKFEAGRKKPYKAAITTENIAALYGGRTPDGTFAKALDFIFNYSPVGGRLPTRLLVATDDLWKVTGYRSQVEVGGLRMAREEAIAAGRAKDKAWISKRAREITTEMPEELHMEALTEARRATFTDPMTSGAWQKVEGFALKAKDFPGIGRYIVPFVRTPLNLIRWAAHRSPLAVGDQEVRAQIAAGGVKRDEAVARIAAGSALMTFGMLLYGRGGKAHPVTGEVAPEDRTIHMTGPGPGESNRDLAKALRRLEYMPRSIVFPGNMFSDNKDRVWEINRVDPVGMILGAAADVRDVMFWAEDDETIDQIALDVAIAQARLLKDKSFWKGFTGFVGALEDPERKMSRLRDNIMGSLVPTILSDTNRALVDETAREVNGILAKWCSRLPGCSDELPPARTFWGDIRTYDDFSMVLPTQIYTRDEKDTDPIDRETVQNLRIGISDVPNKWQGIDLRDVIAEDDEGNQRSAHERWQELRGRIVRDPATGKNLVETLLTMIASREYQQLTTGPDGQRVITVRATFAAFNEIARSVVISEFPELSQKLLDVRRREAIQLTRQDEGPMELREYEALQNEFNIPALLGGGSKK